LESLKDFRVRWFSTSPKLNSIRPNRILEIWRILEVRVSSLEGHSFRYLHMAKNGSEVHPTPFQWVPEASFPGDKMRQGRATDHSSQYMPESKNLDLYICVPNMSLVSTCPTKIKHEVTHYPLPLLLLRFLNTGITQMNLVPLFL
jgi:hypothetical protein